MPIGVPRIIYCWGEELPAQWTDIYNFIFRRRMVFLMQYLDDELCNQICGLLINIHMEDRSKELEKKEIERSGLFKGGPKTQKAQNNSISPPQRGGELESGPSSFQNKKSNSTSFEDLLAADEDLGIDENNTLEQYTLQKITIEWLNWNAQFFDYSDEPYLFYLAEMLSKDFNKKDARLLFSNNVHGESTSISSTQWKSQLKSNFSDKTEKNYLDIYSPFRVLANFNAQDYDLKKINPLAYSCLDDDVTNSNLKNESVLASKRELLKLFNSTLLKKGGQSNNMSKLLTELAQKNWVGKTNDAYASQNLFKTSEKALSQRSLRKEYVKDKTLNNYPSEKIQFNSLNYLDFYSYNDSYNEFRNKPRGKQAERAFQEEEAKKVFVIINSFGGSVGNGITVHDALQFIKAGSLTLALGVAASAASLALAGGTIGERYVTEGCHVMIHQPESSIQGQASDIWIDSQEIMKIRLDVAEIYSLATYRPRHKILRDLDRDFYLTATETIHYGLADEIASNSVMQDIIEMTSKVWDYHDTKQQRLLESRDTTNSAVDTQSQN